MFFAICFKCGKRGHIQVKCTDDGKKDEEKNDKSGETWDDKSKATKGNEEANKTNHRQGHSTRLCPTTHWPAPET